MWEGVVPSGTFENVSLFAVGQSDFLPEYFSLTEKPPEEFCLSPDASSSSQSHLAVDLTQKRGTVKHTVAMEMQPQPRPQTASEKVCYRSQSDHVLLLI